MSRPVHITGYGVISALGNTTKENKEALLAEKSGIDLFQNVNSIYCNKLLVGQIKQKKEKLQEKAKLQNVSSNSRVVLLASIAIREAIEHATLNQNDIEKAALISGTSVGGMELFESGWTYFLKDESFKESKYFVEHDCGNLNSKLAREFGFRTYMSCISTACSSSANAILLGARLIKNGVSDIAIVGGSDGLSKFTINGFHSLGILDEKATKPFSEDRNGLNLGEGAAYLVLESEERAKLKHSYGKIIGYGNANDAFHQTASSDEGLGAFLSMQKAFDMASISASKIDYINTHGTGTKNNDLTESRAMINIFGKEKMPKFNSFKPYIGHTLAACGSIEMVYTLFSMQTNHLFKHLNFNEAIKETQLIPILKQENTTVKYALCNSFGFGGNCTSIILEKN